jgi:hypothetical protein
MILIPAYGRDYKTEKQAMADYLAGKDFKIADISCPWDGSYASCRDFKGKEVKIRFNQLQDFVLVIA